MTIRSATTTAQDESAVRAVLDGVDAAWAANDADAFVVGYAEDATATLPGTYLAALDHRGRRVLPSGLGGPSDDPEAPPVPAGPEVVWLQPIPSGLVSPESEDPAVVVVAREELRLALVACR